MFDKASRATSISSGGAFVMSGDQGDESSHRERAAYLFCRAEEQSAPEGRASAAPRRGGGDAATLGGAAASDSPPSVRPTGGGGMLVAHSVAAAVFFGAPAGALVVALS